MTFLIFTVAIQALGEELVPHATPANLAAHYFLDFTVLLTVVITKYRRQITAYLFHSLNAEGQANAAASIAAMLGGRDVGNISNQQF